MAIKTDISQKWFEQQGWEEQDFQKDVRDAIDAGKSGLLNAPTGSGKTYAVWIPLISKWSRENPDPGIRAIAGLKVLWITPLRALSHDICNTLDYACQQMDMPWRVELRTGDTSTSQRQKQKRNMPQGLVTTPESLHVLLSQKQHEKMFKGVQAIVVDEWHELMGSKRGTQVELALSRLRAINPDLLIWGISATIQNLEEANEVLQGSPDTGVIVRSGIKKEIRIETLVPDEVEKFSWGGHLGIKLLEKVVPVIDAHKTTLIFTNTRSQCEIWYQALLDNHPSLAGQIAMHHGSLDREVRDWVESALHEGILKAVVCTSSLDLGVDYRPVETVVQIGSPKGVARFLQRAGRSGHQPDRASVIYFLPTHNLEILEGAALREAIAREQVEPRQPPIMPIDVLIQYLVTLAVGDGFDPRSTYKEIISAYSYRELTPEDWNWVLGFLSNGGKALTQYDNYAKVEEEDGLMKVTKRSISHRHRMSIGTIVGDTAIKVKWLKGGLLGTVEEYFIARLKPGDSFMFAGRLLEFVRFKEMVAYVRKSKKKKGATPQWMGGRMDLSSKLSDVFREKIDAFTTGEIQDPEMETLVPIMDLQNRISEIPAKDELLVEYFESNKKTYHLIFFPFEGRNIHELLSSLIAYRIGREVPLTFSLAFNDYGFELSSDQPIPIERFLDKGLFSPENLMDDVMRSINAAEMARRKFRDISVIAGLVFKGFPGNIKRTKHLQASSSLLFEVFSEYDPNNLLMRQAFNEVFFDQFDEVRLRGVMNRIDSHEIIYRKTEKPSPFAFPIIVEMLRERVSTESLEDRVRRMLKQMELD